MRLARSRGVFFASASCVHMGDHEDTLGIGIHRHRRDQPRREAGGEDFTLFACGFVEVFPETRLAHAGFHPFPYEQRRPARRRSAFTKGKSRHKSKTAAMAILNMRQRYSLPGAQMREEADLLRRLVRPPLSPPI